MSVLGSIGNAITSGIKDVGNDVGGLVNGATQGIHAINSPMINNQGGLQNTAQPSGPTMPTQPTTTPSTGSNSNASLQALQQMAAQQNSYYAQLLAAEKAAIPPTGLTGAQLNLPQLQNSANSQASTTTNALYNQYINEYAQNLAQSQSIATQQNAYNIQGIQQTEANTLAQNQLSQNAAASSNELTQGNINAQQQNYQITTGDAQAQKIQALQSANGAGGLGSSGAGQQQVWMAENQRNLADAAQSNSFQYQRDTSNLSTQDTFAQLAQSSLYAQQGANTQEAATNFNLQSYIAQSNANDQLYQQQLQQELPGATEATYQNLLSTSLQNEINSKNLGSGQLSATEQEFAPELNAVQAPTFTAPSLSDTQEGNYGYSASSI